MINTSGLVPLGRAVLVKPYMPEIKAGSIILPPDVLAKTQTLDQRAIVVEVGPVAWANEPTPRAKVGDKVMVAKFSGVMAVGPADGQQYRIINDSDIFAGIVSEQSEEKQA